MIFPAKKEFLEIVKKGKIPPLFKEIPYASPCSIYEAFASPNSFLLESVKGPLKIARYSFVGFDPRLTLKIKNAVLEIQSFKKEIMFTKHPLNIMKQLSKLYNQLPFNFLPPFQGGFVGILSYDFVHYLEELPKNALDDLNLPDAHFFMIDKLIAIDHFYKKGWIIICPGLNSSIRKNISTKLNWSEIYDEAEQEIGEINKKMKKKLGKEENISFIDSSRKVEISYEMKKQEYMDIVKRAKDYISAGDIFQANLSQRVSAFILNRNTWHLYKILKSINPSPFAAYVDFDDYKIVSSSPERLLRVKGKDIETRPIAGTRPRGRNSIEDELLRAELLLNEKERAEHIMLIDLERNDIGRVSDYGSVRVDEMMITEDYSHVIHIVSNITGKLSEGKDCFDAIKAAFPGGTITGVPKVRCMEIIDELEPVCRGPYTGSIGYISFSGNMDLNIVIRTFVIKNGFAYVQAGAGIVADSDPEREYYETLKKAEALIKTLEKV